MAKDEIAWDLSEIFPSTTDPSVQKAIDQVTKAAETFSKNYRGKIGNFSAEEILKCVQESEAYQAKLQDITLYAGLSFSANMTLPDTQALYDKVSKLEARLGK